MRVALHNLGCKVNAYETEAMSQQFGNAGYEIVDFKEIADIYIINTCSVTNVADRKSRQMLHRSKKQNENAIVVAVGCYAQVAAEQLEQDEAIDIVVGNNKKKEIVQIVENYIKDRKENKKIIDVADNCEYEEIELETVTDYTRAYIKVQDGCNQFCSYCIIPYARGRIRSRDAKNVYEEIKRLVEQGFMEFVITGIHLSSYISGQTRLIDLIENINAIPGVERIRLGSLEPGIITEEFAGRLSKCEKVCQHFHLSMQSGCDTVLQRMNRRYDSSLYYQKCQILQKYFENPAFTTDVIVGFPGETDEEFETTLKFVEKVGFAELHVFKYSKRNGTKAAVMPNQVDEKIKSVRSDRLIELGENLKDKYRKTYIGKTIPVLMEEHVEIDGVDFQVGHTKEYIKVAVKTDMEMCGTIENLKILERLNGEIMLATI